MSAKNHTDCPRCHLLARERRKTAREKLQSRYGKVSAEQYARLHVALLNEERQAANAVPDDSLREDYELGIEEGVFKVRYSCSCNRCGFHFEYKGERGVPGLDQPA